MTTQGIAPGTMPTLGPTEVLSLGKWDYKNPLPPALSPEFYSSYIINIKGKSYVKVEGLVTLMHAKGFKSITPELVQFPNTDNNGVAIFKVTIEGWGWDPVEEKVIPVTVIGHGDACVANCNSMVAAHFIRIAETRAIGRALRTYTNVNICTLEELDSVIQVEMISSAQMTQLSQVMGQYGITKDEAKAMMLSSYGKYSSSNLSSEEATGMISILTTYGINKTHSPSMNGIPAQQTTTVPNAYQNVQGATVQINPDLDNLPG